MYRHAICLGMSKIWEEEREGNQTSHTNMMRDSWIYNKLVVAHRHGRVTRLCLRSLRGRNTLVGATATKRLLVISYVYTQLCHDKNRIYREGKKKR